jgi:hypothetical protein
LSNESATDNFESMADTPILIAGARAIAAMIDAEPNRMLTRLIRAAERATEKTEKKENR